VAHTASPRLNIARDLPFALVLHGGLAAVVLLMRFGAPPPPLEVRSAVLWLTPPMIQTRPPEPDLVVERTAEPEVVVGPAPQVTRVVPRAEPEPRARTQSPSPATPADRAEPEAPAPPRPAIDWERERRAVLDRLRQEPSGRYATFSTDDFGAPPALLADDAPSGEIFSPNRHEGPSLFSPGKQHTRFGRKLAEICHALTGGFGVGFQGFALFSACAGEGGRSDLFAAIKPEYLKVVPDCTTDLPKEVREQIPSTLVRCRLVAPPGESPAPVPE